MKNQIAIERFNIIVREIDIIKNFFPTPDLFASLPATEIDSSLIIKKG